MLESSPLRIRALRKPSELYTMCFLNALILRGEGLSIVGGVEISKRGGTTTWARR
ncbi:uncharacterized protein G2W53_036941 [Senna tora]|uniref:Uncharacterized protein n=1 Tax=Senna tora TaxID=362788 RepID=A0A834W6L4_9FABA|nr:uncharacterized protein G2W53_036941 [Senna tora]